ncbi:polysaccharide deacetylase [Saccharopolyspora erythraea]|nr:polysaccharide deacetylase [Saccharopolyspora erythraea]
MTGFSEAPRWPGGARCAVMLSFDVDGPTLWVDRSTGRFEDVRGFSLGAYGPYRGVPRILGMLDRLGVPATFFVPGKTIEQWPAVVADIARSGHEIGHHGWLHETFFDHPPARQRDIITRSQDLLHEVTGTRAVGFRSPSGDIAVGTPGLLAELGFSYSSSMRGDDRPYRWCLDGRRSDLIEIPAHWELDDYHQFVYHDDPAQPRGLDRISSTAATFDIWRREFDGYHRFGLCYVLMMHPQVIGTPARMHALAELVAYIRAHQDVWFATGEQIAAWWRDGARQ